MTGIICPRCGGTTVVGLVVALGLAVAGVPTARAVEHGSFDSGGVKIDYQEEGSGTPVLLIHGFTATADLNWRVPGITSSLAKKYRVIALDNRGHGASDKPHQPEQYGEEMVADAVRLLDHLHVERAHVIGYSMGGFITAQLLVKHPERLLSATLGGAGWPRPSPEFTALRERVATSLEKGEGLAPLLIALTPAGRPKPTEAELKLADQFILGSNDALALAAAMRGMSAWEVTADQLRANRVPCLAVIGANDPLKEGVDALDGVLAELQVVVIPEADHMSTIFHPDFVQALHDFLAK